MNKTKMDITQQTEPVRKTFLDVLRDNLRRANKVTFIHRLIYIGDHSFRDAPGSSIGDCMEKTILKVNNEYHDEPVSGLLLVYPKYFCHIIEGSEDSLFKQLKLLTSVKEYASKLGRLKLLVCYHHCNQRFLPGWLSITGKPPTLLERIQVHNDLYGTSRYVNRCVEKLYKLCLLQRPKLSRVGESFAAKSGSSIGTSDTRLPEDTKTNVSFIQEKYPDCLPEYGLVEFLLSARYTQDLRVYIKSFGIIPPLDAYKDKVWPVPTEFVPFNIFDKPYDPVTDLPTAKQEENLFPNIE